jgi:undecaprenyl diphosphate synthase
MDLQHIAIIPDGNRRWAKKNSLKAIMGHEKGVDAFEKILEKSIELKIPYFTFWGASFDNLTKRPKNEINNLLKIFHKQFERLLKEERIDKEQVKIRVIGRFKEVLPKETIDLIDQCTQKTKNYNKYNLTLLLAYNGTDEIIDCIKNIKGEVTEEKIKQNLWTHDLPPVDFVIRTGALEDPHNSAGFMMWDTAYSQLYFTKTLFPEFTTKKFEIAIDNYKQRKRRKGE